MNANIWARYQRLSEQRERTTDSRLIEALEDQMDREVNAIAAGAPRTGTGATALDNYRRKRRKRARIEIELAPLMARLVDPWPEAERRIMWDRAMARMKPAARQLYVMLARGHTYAELAERDGVPVGTLKSRAHRAKQNMAA